MGTHRPEVPVAGLWRALGLAAASSVVWGLAHVRAGRRVTGYTLMAALAALITGGAAVALASPSTLKQAAVRGAWLDAIIVGLLVLSLVEALVVIRSFQVLRPAGLPAAIRGTAGALVVVLALLVCTPLVYAANAAYVLRDTLAGIFPGDDRSGAPVDAADPFKGRPRLNVLLLGGDGGRDRTGIRTDSMTVASVDTRTGDTVLLSVPRDLQYFPMPPKLHAIFPNGYRPAPGSGFDGLINEIYILGERNPAYTTPGLKAGQRGPHLLEDVIGNLLGLKIDYYVLVNLEGFRDIVDAMGGVRVNVEKRLPIGGDKDRGIRVSGYLEPGRQRLTGEQALWYARSRHADDDFYRIDRQKCLMKDIADQADPKKVLTHFEKLAGAAKKTISTNIPAALLPALVTLSGRVKHGGDIRSLPFNPRTLPGFHVAPPSLAFMRRVTARAIAKSGRPAGPVTPGRTPAARSGGSRGGVVSLKSACG